MMTDDPNSFRDDSLAREELLDLAAADAIGALDAVDQARFERAFAASAPSVQAEARAIQDRIVQDHLAAGGVFRSTEQPPASLRLKTLARVASAIEAEGAAPIAVIGPTRGAPRASAGPSEGSRDALLREILQRAELERRPTQHLWRVAALFLFAALVVALFFNSEQRKIAERLMDYVDGRMTETSVQALARMTESFDFARARQLQVLDAEGRPVRVVHAYLDESTREICVIGFGVVDPSLAVRVLSNGAQQLAATIVENRGFGMRFKQPEDARELRLEVGDTAMRILI
jgi:hypothetical protein